MKSKIIKVRYPNLRGNSIKSAAHTNQERLLKSLNSLLLKENLVNGRPEGFRGPSVLHSKGKNGDAKGSGIDAPRASTKNKKPKTFAL